MSLAMVSVNGQYQEERETAILHGLLFRQGWREAHLGLIDLALFHDPTRRILARLAIENPGNPAGAVDLAIAQTGDGATVRHEAAQAAGFDGYSDQQITRAFLDLRGPLDDEDLESDVREALAADTRQEKLVRLRAAVDSHEARGPASERRGEVVQMLEVEPQEVEWVWPGRVALGKLTLIAGDPGLGKSFITLDMAARVSSGTPWPDARTVPNEPGGVVLLSAEDDLADTIRPRLDAAGADVARIVALGGVKRINEDGRTVSSGFCLTRDLEELARTISDDVPECRLVIIDPISAYLGRVDSHKNAELRSVLTPLAQLAAEHHVAVVAVTHLNKAAGGPAIYRSMGSLAFVAAARTAWAVTKDREDPRRRLMVTVKNNIAPDVHGLAYRIDSPSGTPVVCWEDEPVTITADEALAPDRGENGDRPAAEWLRELLADRGAVKASEILAEGEDLGFSRRTTRNAFAKINGHRRRLGFGRGSQVYWSLEAIGATDDPIDVIGATP